MWIRCARTSPPPSRHRGGGAANRPWILGQAVDSAPNTNTRSAHLQGTSLSAPLIDYITPSPSKSIRSVYSMFQLSPGLCLQPSAHAKPWMSASPLCPIASWGAPGCNPRCNKQVPCIASNPHWTSLTAWARRRRPWICRSCNRFRTKVKICKTHNVAGGGGTIPSVPGSTAKPDCGMFLQPDKVQAWLWAYQCSISFHPCLFGMLLYAIRFPLRWEEAGVPLMLSPPSIVNNKSSVCCTDQDQHHAWSSSEFQAHTVWEQQPVPGSKHYKAQSCYNSRVYHLFSSPEEGCLGNETVCNLSADLYTCYIWLLGWMQRPGFCSWMNAIVQT